MSDLISRQATYLALVEKGQASKRYKLGETWELNGEEIREVLDALPSAQSEQTKMIIKEIREWINSGNRGSADYFIVDKIEEIINKYE